MSVPHDSAPVGGVGRLLRFALKELREILRDRRTVVTLVLMPLLLYPLLAVTFRQVMLANAVVTKPQFRLGIEVLGDPGQVYDLLYPDNGLPALAKADHQLLNRLLATGRIALAQAESAIDTPWPGDSPEPNLTMPEEMLNAEEPLSLSEALRSEMIHLGLRLRPSSEIGGAVGRQPPVVCEFLVLERSAASRDALTYVRQLLASTNLVLINPNPNLRGPADRWPAMRLSTQLQTIKDPQRRAGSALATLIPLILILMTITGAVYPAIDLTAGERERGTLEVLMAAPIPRMDLLVAKYIAVLAVALLTALVNLGMMTVTLLVSGLGPVLFEERGLTLATALEVLALLLLFALFFSAVLLAVTSFARSFKEAQAYLIPLMLLSIAPGVMALLPGLKLEGALLVTPLVNGVLLAREVLDPGGKPTALAAAVVVGSTLLYAAAALAIAARIFGAEAVLYSDQGGWGDVFRRPRHPRERAPLSNAMLCLALMFPAHFLLIESLKGVVKDQPEASMPVMALVSVCLFVGFPAIGAWLGRVRVTSGFQLRAGPWLAYFAALLLGVSLWPFAAELLRFLHQIGLSSDLGKFAEEAASRYRDAGLLPTILTIGILAPIVEELFFRGYLFNALRAHNPGRATVLTTAVLFGVFHLITPVGLAWDRFVVTAFLGFILGWMRLRSGSVLPGMLLHACHNSLLVTAALRPDWFGALADPLTSQGGHLPPVWLVSAGVLVGIAIAMLALCRTPNDEPDPEIAE